MGEKPGLRETADKLRQSVYESSGGNPHAVRQAEKYIKTAILELDKKGRSGR